MKENNRTISLCITMAFLIILLSVVFFTMYKYQVEGEKKLPFNITKLITVSTAETEKLELNDHMYQANVIQKNDIFIAIEKNENYNKKDSIKKITFNNFKILEQGKGTIKIYRTSQTEKTFEYTEENQINEKIEFIGAQETNLKLDQMTISNQGGLLKFSVVLNELGKITYPENENVKSDGTLLKMLNLKEEDIKTKISFDMIMELNGGNTFKTTIILELPSGNIAEEGVNTTEKTDLSNLVFKRI